MNLKGKTVVVGVTGGIAAYKTCEIVSSLKKEGAEVFVVMTKNATNFVAPLTFETLSNNRVITDTFDREFEWEVEHISLAKKADIFVVAPCTANFAGKLAHGIADDFLSTTAMAVTCPILLAPAMNTNMLNSEGYGASKKMLVQRGVNFVSSESGRLACGDIGDGRLAEPLKIVEAIHNILFPIRDYEGKTVLVTAGATMEAIDPVRFISNHSSGKMGFELARAVSRRGGHVILVVGESCSLTPDKDWTVIKVKSTMDMYNEVMRNLKDSDIIIKAAAPSDYKVKNVATNKIKDKAFVLELEKNPDIAAEVGRNKGDKKLVIFSAETEKLLDNAKAKLKSKNADMVIANNVTKEGAGFNIDTNIVTIITNNEVIEHEKQLKSILSDIILDNLAKLFKK